MRHLECRSDEECVGYPCVDGFCDGPPPGGVCGDGAIDPGEECDGPPSNPGASCVDCVLLLCPEGHVHVDPSHCEARADREACLATCVPDTCGDGVVSYPAEKCDDADLDDTDECLSTCRKATCGDGYVQAGVELCDDANLVPSDGCDERCTVTTCGDGAVQAPEECDDGNPDNADSCSDLCLRASCGDGVVQAGEECDDGNHDDWDTCRGDCVLARCGDGVVQEGEECDDGVLAHSGDCVPGCRSATCGDGFVHELEGCDDPVWCPACYPPTCGDGLLDPGEECDPAGLDPGECTPYCQLPRCGDGFVQSGEACDDLWQHAIGCAADCSSQDPIIRVEAGGFHTCVITGQGALRCWGRNQQCQLGVGDVGTIGDDEGPGAVSPVDLGGFGVKAVAPGGSHTCALLGDASVRCWGGNAFGQLGRGHEAAVPCASNLPGEVVLWQDPGEVTVALAAGDRHTCALSGSGRVRCWGSNESGQLGLGHTQDVGDDELPFEAEEVDVGGFALQIAASGHNTCALREDGGLRCWGRNLSGSLGYGHVEPLGDDEPLAAVGDVPLQGATRVALGPYHTCALLGDQTLACWGRNIEGALGLPSTSLFEPWPVSAVAGADIDAVQLGAAFTCVLRFGGAVQCWGSGKEGQLASGGVEPVLLPFASDVPFGDVFLDQGRLATALTTGNSHACALLQDGTLRCWGQGYDGQLGYAAQFNLGDEPSELPLGVPVLVFGVP